jgi:amino acid adenylation domain-containing protein
VSKGVLKLPPEQQAIRAKCLHPDGGFVEFTKEETEQSIAGRFENIVRKFPDRLAVKAGDRSLSYEALNRAANRVARAILAKCGPGSKPIALLFEHGIDAIVAILGTLKAGKFYFALDPLFPKERIAYMLEDAQAGLIVTNDCNANLAHRLTNKARGFLNIDQIDDSFPGENVALAASPDDIAAIVYTSGSTGKPKAVVQNHRNHLCSVMVNSNEMHISFHDRLTLLHSISFGSSRGHLFQALLNGAALFPYDIKGEGIYSLPAWLSEEQITIFHSPPAVFRQLAELLSGQKRLSSLRLIRLSGAPITEPDFDLYKKSFSPSTLLEIHLGSTETRAICFALVDHTFAFPKQGSPVGYCCPDKKIFLLNEDGDEVEPGEVGEIAVQGPNLNPTYWKKAELGSAKFLPDPSDGDERTYLTGDLGRMLPDGFLIHLGRKDSMVKIRGYRVETSEIEAALLAHPQVQDAGVLPWDRESGEKYLVAYIVVRDNGAPTPDQLHRFLETKLPDYMMPSRFLFLTALPLTNGKLNRAALPLPDRKRPDFSQSFVPPVTEIEQKLVGIWEEVLDIRPIGIHDNFFDLGGHSLLASQVLSRIRDDLQIDLSLGRLFETPTVAALASYIARALPTEDRTEALSIRLASRDGQLLLSLTQQRLWFIDQLDPGSTAYNLFSAVRLTGPLNAPALERSINEIIRRHEVLRTVFKTVDGEPLQIILPSMTIKVPNIDLRGLVSDREREFEVRRLSSGEAQRPFDLSDGPLLRVTLLRLAEDEYVLLLTIHQIAFDGWSRGILNRELSVLYAAFSSGQTASLPALPIQYIDFAQWQRQRLHGKVVEEQLAYWKKQLEDLPTVELPTDRPRPPVQGTRGARQSFVLSETLSAGLKNLSNRHGVTLFMTLLAAYQTLLHRYTGQDDIVVGSPVAGRDRIELESLIGFFLNMLVLRTDLSGNPTFRELLSHTRELCLEAYANQDVPFERLVRELQPQRDVSHNPLFQVTFALQSNPTCPLNLAGLTVEDVDMGSGIAPFDLHLFIVEEERGLRGWLIYKRDLFDPSTVERWASHFQTILKAIVVNPEQRLSEISLLTEGERHQLLVEWNDTNGDYPSDRCIHEVFEAQVERTPDAIAAVFEDQQLTYRELNRLANQLAHYLKKLGVGPDVLVSICIERSLEMIIGLLGILKAGGAYVPLDPEYPRERLRFMLEDTRAPVLLTQKKFLGTLLETIAPKESVPGMHNRQSKIQNAVVVSLDGEWEKIEEEGEGSIVSGATADNLAYVIYTSGSTGTPKGVAVAHLGVTRLLFGVDYIRLDSSQIFLQLASPSFDASTFEIWGALLHGAKCVLYPGNIPAPTELGKVLHQNNVNTLWLTASFFNLVIDQAPEALRGIRQLLVGGESLSVPHVRRALTLLPETEIINGYGPTESTTFTCCYSLPRELTKPITSVSVGRPISNTEVYLLDSNLSPVPVGVSGELYIGGDGLARGYLNRPDLTAEKFIPNPVGSEPGARLYKTGDLARYLPDGNVEFLGRMDHQVKIRGFRIELGEIEIVLSQHPAVREAVVLAREDVPEGNDEIQNPKSDKRLVAYVASRQAGAPTVNELRNFVKEKLPQYMVPSEIVFMDSLPLTPNGKIDRRALPAPDHDRPALGGIFVAPRTPTEQIIAEIWTEVLGVKKIGIHDNFFDLGGHSLRATQVVSRLGKAFQADVPLRSLFEHPTVEGLAVIVAQRQARKAEADEMATILARIESLSEADVQRQLAREKAQRQR